jgi:hypothetical protein
LDIVRIIDRPEAGFDASLIDKGNFMSLLLARPSRPVDPGDLPPRRRALVWRPVRISIRALVGVALAALIAGDVFGASADSHREGATPAPVGPGAPFATVEAAALGALAWVTREKTPADRGRVLVGTIHIRPDGQYAYRRPTRSKGTLFQRRPPVLRLLLHTGDVASYVVYPKTGASRVDRLNEQPSADLRRVVDEVDPRRRPLYLLTPSLRVVRYAARTTSLVAGRGMRPIRSSEEAGLARAATLTDAIARAWRTLFAQSPLTTASR